MCRLKDDDDGAAKVDVVEATAAPKEYEYPDNNMIRLVDLPGIGTPDFPDLETYCKKVGLENYDTFLIFTKDRFTINDLRLAEKVKSFGKSFFLIRTKIDADLTPKTGKAPINEEQMLKKIRKNLTDNVKDLISSEKEIFLLSNYDKNKWDFEPLVKAIGNALPVLQREVLLLSLSNLTRGCIKRNAMILQGWSCLVMYFILQCRCMSMISVFFIRMTSDVLITCYVCSVFTFTFCSCVYVSSIIMSKTIRRFNTYICRI